MSLFNWKDFRNYRIVVHCKNKKEEDDFIENAERHGFKNNAFKYGNLSDNGCYVSLFVPLLNYNCIIAVEKTDGYRILEWADYMGTLDESGIKIGMLVKNNHYYMYGYGIVVPSGNDNFVIYENEKWSNIVIDDITEVYGYPTSPCKALTFTTESRCLLYRRGEVREMTVEEVSKALGYAVRIVKG